MFSINNIVIPHNLNNSANYDNFDFPKNNYYWQINYNSNANCNIISSNINNYHNNNHQNIKMEIIPKKKYLNKPKKKYIIQKKYTKLKTNKNKNTLNSNYLGFGLITFLSITIIYYFHQTKN